MTFSQHTMQFFWSKVDKSAANGCWLWTCTTTCRGYGAYQRRKGDPPGSNLAHRISYEMMCGAIPSGMDCCHTCDTPACVNPDHLFVGTRKDNLADMVRKGRSNSRGSTLSVDVVLEIVKKHQAGCRQRDLVTEYGLSRDKISRIVNGKTWSAVTGIKPRCSKNAANSAQKGVAR